MRKLALIALLIGLSLIGSTRSVSSKYQEEEGGRPALAKAVAGAKISLEQALDTISRDGKPLSARFEIEDGWLQASVLRARGDQFAEVILDPTTGAVSEVDPITSGGDYDIAQKRNAAMAKATRSLRAAVGESLKAEAGFRAVSVVPSVKDDHPVAEVSLAKENEWKRVSVRLD